MKKIHVIYEDGVFKPTEPVNLPENSEVEFEVNVADASEQPSIADVYAVLENRYDSEQHDVAERHDEHQP
ncbi:MAG: antitoxin family protein [Pirellulaceae bacterium]|nr:antitoxin family protein [Pirellulaceae bacterium]